MILQRASALKMQVAPYLRYVASNPVIKHYNYEVVADQTRTIGNIRTSINQLIFTIEATNNYLLRKIETIVSLMPEIFRTKN